MRHAAQWIIILTMVFGGLSLSSCDNQLKNDMMTPGGIVNGNGGGSGSGGGGGTNPGGGGGTNPGGGGGTNPGGGGGTNPGGGGGGGTSSDIQDYLHKTEWYATDNGVSGMQREIYFYENYFYYTEESMTQDLLFFGTYTTSGNKLTINFSTVNTYDDKYEPIFLNLSDYISQLAKTATLSSDKQTISYGGHTYKQDTSGN